MLVISNSLALCAIGALRRYLHNHSRSQRSDLINTAISNVMCDWVGLCVEDVEGLQLKFVLQRACGVETCSKIKAQEPR